ncbi:MAG: helix-turn-helix transcriptional regulator [Firmicutes bacterium]|jgi:DNA-binding HxlR family transcriptional regulator|nr:helix-turn-helix transcriptional regulator [Bacillota bacterium]
MIKYKNKEYYYPLDFGMDLVRGKWKSIILCNINDSPKRFSELDQILSGISQKVLSENLSQLEEENLIIKNVLPVIPPHVEYSLTDKGSALLKILHNLEEWVNEYYPEIKKDKEAGL